MGVEEYVRQNKKHHPHRRLQINMVYDAPSRKLPAMELKKRWPETWIESRFVDQPPTGAEKEVSVMLLSRSHLHKIWGRSRTDEEIHQWRARFETAARGNVPVNPTHSEQPQLGWGSPLTPSMLTTIIVEIACRLGPMAQQTTCSQKAWQNDAGGYRPHQRGKRPTTDANKDWQTPGRTGLKIPIDKVKQLEQLLATNAGPIY
jgi:hypothetical protein